jgi:DNA-binding transcriptional ArsR family regulator
MSGDICQTDCQVNVIHQEQVNQAMLNMPDESLLTATSELFSLLGDVSRLRILQALITTELCVCDLASILGVSSSAVSHQLRLLRANGMVRYRKEGKIAYYSLADKHVHSLLTATFEHLENC